MTPDELVECTHRLKFIAGTNQRYHHKLAWRWGVVDKSIRIAIGVTSVVGMCLSVSGDSFAWWSTAVGWISLGVAVALNVIPTGDYEKTNLDLFRRWSDLYKYAQTIQSRSEIDGKDAVSPESRSRLAEAIEMEHTLHASQTAPFPALLEQCQKEETLATYGVDTFDKVHAMIDSKFAASQHHQQAAVVARAAVVGEPAGETLEAAQ